MEIDNNSNDDNFSIASFDDTWLTEYLDNQDSQDNQDNQDNNNLDLSANSKYIKCYFLYIDKDPGTLNTINSNIIKTIKNKYIEYTNCIKKQTIINLIKEYSFNEEIEYRVSNILKYQNEFTNKDLENLITDVDYDSSFNFLTIYKSLQDIIINDNTLEIFLPLNSLYFIFIDSTKKEKNFVIPSLKIPYTNKKEDRKTKFYRISQQHNKTKKYKISF